MQQYLQAIERLIVIVGCQRSGTTLTGQILGAAVDAVLIDEFDGLYPWFGAMMAGPADDDANARLIAAAARKYGADNRRFVIKQDGLYLAAHVKVLVLKAPNLTYDEDLVSRAPWPVTVVYPVRDPRAVAASMARLDDVDFVTNQIRLIEQRPAIRDFYASAVTRMADQRVSAWTRRATLWQVKSGREADFEGAGCAVHRFRYEDLIADRSAIISAMFEACGLDDPRRGVAAHLNYSGVGPGRTDRTRPIDSCSLRSMERLTADQRAEVMQAAAPLAERFGYG